MARRKQIHYLNDTVIVHRKGRVPVKARLAQEGLELILVFGNTVRLKIIPWDVLVRHVREG